jgi:hypothetical protein
MLKNWHPNKQIRYYKVGTFEKELNIKKSIVTVIKKLSQTLIYIDEEKIRG